MHRKKAPSTDAARGLWLTRNDAIIACTALFCHGELETKREKDSFASGSTSRAQQQNNDGRRQNSGTSKHAGPFFLSLNRTFFRPPAHPPFLPCSTSLHTRLRNRTNITIHEFVSSGRPAGRPARTKRTRKSMRTFESDCNDGKGNAVACHQVGEYLSVVKNDFAKAGKIFQTNCNTRGHAPSCFNLGRFLREWKEDPSVRPCSGRCAAISV